MKVLTQTTRFKGLRARLLIELVECARGPYALLFRQGKIPWGISREQLSHYPNGSLGKHLAEFLFQEDFQVYPLFENHDVYHVLFEYGTEVVAETQMQFFLWGNGKRSVFTGGTCLLGILFYPEEYRGFLRAFRRGKTYFPIKYHEPKLLLKEPLEQLRNRLQKEK